MQEIEMVDYVNADRRQRGRLNTKQAERRAYHLLYLSFGVLCMIQATLNLSLRLSLYSSQKSSHPDCNTTYFSDNDQSKEGNKHCKQEKPSHCNELQERFNALTRDKNLLENRNSELLNMMKTVVEENARLKMRIRDLDGCASPQQCPPEWREINSRCYFLSTETKTWEDSRKHCQSNGADLVIINSEQEQREIYRLNGDMYLLFWIGLHGTDGTFKWVDGSGPTKFFWQAGQPDHGGPNNVEDCVEMYHQNPVLNNWNDAPCGHKRHWLCEKDLCIINP